MTPSRRPLVLAFASAFLLASSIVAAASPRCASAQIAAPGDIYYRVQIDQSYRYYVSANDVVVWADALHEGIALAETAARETTIVGGNHGGVLGTSVVINADAGLFTADFDSHVDISARTGVNDLLANTAVVDVYVKGPSGTPWWITRLRSGSALASRLGGLPGSLAPLNGNSYAAFAGSSAYIDSTGVVSVAVDDTLELSGITTDTLVVGADTYSLAASFTLAAPAEARQAVCVLGCMAEAADFDAHASGRVTLNVYPYAEPVSAPAPRAFPASLALSASPNPAHTSTTLEFRAAAGDPVALDVFDVRGRRVARLFEGVATGGAQRVAWADRGVPSGIYLARLRSGSGARTCRITVVE
jgi:hypothetical protein